MTEKTFKIIDAANRNGYDNTECGFEADISSTKEYFGSVEDIELKGYYMYIYMEAGDTLSFDKEEYQPDHILHQTDSDALIHLFILK